ncbi:MAG: T9SS type A sorting domain-containing protein [Ferruginibacter sp.]
MKKIITFLLVLFIAVTGIAQPYFQATMQNTGNTLTFKIKPVNGDIVNRRYSAMEFFVRYPVGSPAFTFSAPVTDPAFTGINFTVKGPNLYGSETGYTNYVFEWIGGATAVPASPTTYTNGVEYTVFTVDLVGSPNLTTIEFVHNTNQSPTYINISDNNANSLSCIDNLGNTIGDAFYGPGFLTGPSPAGGTDHLLPLLNVPIPVKFNGFTAAKKDNSALLNWWVENETSLTDHYEVERSLNSVDFIKAATVAPKNNGNSSNAYTLTDQNLSSLRSSGVIYYRIRQVDRDGRFITTEIKTVRLDKGIAIGIYPNPVKDAANVTLDLLEASEVIIAVTDAIGKEVQKVIVQANKGSNMKQVNMSNLPGGSYIFKVTAGNEVKILSVVKEQ